MRDPRVDEYARLLVERSIGVEPGWQIAIRATPLARPLVEAMTEQIARRGAYPILQLSFEQIGGPFAREAPIDVLAQPAPLLAHIWNEVRWVHLDLGPREQHVRAPTCAGSAWWRSSR